MHELQWGNLMEEVVVFSNPGYFECVLKLYLSDFLHSEIIMHSLKNLLIIQKIQVCMEFSRSCRQKSVKMANIHDKMANLFLQSMALCPQTLQQQGFPNGGIFDVQNAAKVFEQLKVILNSMWFEKCTKQLMFFALLISSVTVVPMGIWRGWYSSSAVGSSNAVQLGTSVLLLDMSMSNIDSGDVMLGGFRVTGGATRASRTILKTFSQSLESASVDFCAVTV